MASFVVTTDTIASETLGAAEYGLVTTTGALRNNPTTATMTAGQDVLNNAGLVFSAAGSAVVVASTAYSARIDNTGQLIGVLGGIRYDGASSTISNSGTIDGVKDEGILAHSGSGGLTITNTGLITGLIGINSDISFVRIVNSGTIQGTDSVAIVSSESVDGVSILNTGVIQAASRIAVALGDADNTLINGGSILGVVLLGGGADLYDGAGGRVIAVSDFIGTGRAQGQAGDDTLIGGDGSDWFSGGADDDDLSGGAGNDTLDGGAGADLLDGGDGKDTASYASATAGVLVNLIDPTKNLGDARGDIFDSIEVIEGSAFADTLLGGNAADTLLGGDGNDVLNGGKGADLMRGGRGDDLYRVDHVGDRVVERAGQGNDTVETAVSYTLSPGAEVEVLRTINANATTAINLTGSDTANAISGNKGANLLVGLGGNDTLNGGAGDDTLLAARGRTRWSAGRASTSSCSTSARPMGPTSTSSRTSTRRRTRSSSRQAAFPELALGALDPAALLVGTPAFETAATRLLFYKGVTPDSWRLYYDPDGSGTDYAPQALAFLKGAPVISAADFLVVA